MSILTRRKSIDDILRAVAGSRGVLIIGCHGCAEDSSTGGPKEVSKVAKRLREQNIETLRFSDPCMTYVCWERTVEERFYEIEEVKASIDTILLLSCGAGISCINEVLRKHGVTMRVVPGIDTIGIGHVPLEGKGKITCMLCGNCSLIQDKSGYNVCRLINNLRKNRVRSIK